MESVETLVTAKLDELQRQLAEKEAKRERAEAATKRRGEGEAQSPRNVATAARAREMQRAPSSAAREVSRAHSATQVKLDREIDVLHIKAEVLNEVKGMFEQQGKQISVGFTDLKHDGERSSKQNLWLTIVSSVVSLLVGWLLSLAGSPSLLLSLAHH